MESYISCGSEENVTIKDRYGYPVIVTRAKVSWDPCGYNITIPELPFEKPKDLSEIATIYFKKYEEDIPMIYNNSKVTKGADGSYTIQLCPKPKFSIGDTIVTKENGFHGIITEVLDNIQGCPTYKVKLTHGMEWTIMESDLNLIMPPRFTIGNLFVISSGKLGKVIGDPEYVNGKYTYEIQWTDGKKNKCQPEDSMIKLEESFK